jgi:hypothetical protein
MKPMQTAYQDSLLVIEAKNSEIKDLKTEIEAIHAQSTHTVDDTDADAGFSDRNQAQLSTETTAVIAALGETARFLEAIANDFKEPFISEATNEFKLPRIVTNSGNKSFQNILEHESVRALVDLRTQRAAAAMSNDLKGTVRVFIIETFFDSPIKFATGWNASLSTPAIDDSTGSAKNEAVEGEEANETNDPSQTLARLSKAANDISDLLAVWKIRNSDLVSTDEDPRAVLAAYKTSDIEHYLQRQQENIHLHLKKVKLLETRREFVLRHYKNKDRVVFVDHETKGLPELTPDALDSAAVMIQHTMQRRTNAVPEGIAKPKKPNHKHLLDFSPLKRSGEGHPSFQDLVATDKRQATRKLA